MSKRKSANAKRFAGINWKVTKEDNNILQRLKIKNKKADRILRSRNEQFNRILRKFQRYQKDIEETQINEARKKFLDIQEFKKRRTIRKGVDPYIKSA